MAETSGIPGAPGTAETPNPEGGPVERLERKGRDAADTTGSDVGSDGTGGSVNTGDTSSAADGPTRDTSKAAG